VGRWSLLEPCYDETLAFIGKRGNEQGKNVLIAVSGEIRWTVKESQERLTKKLR